MNYINSNNAKNNYLISVSDIMMGLLFIFIIITVYFSLTAQKMQLEATNAIHKANVAEVSAENATKQATKAKSVAKKSLKRALLAENKAKKVVQKLSGSIATRSELLDTIQARLIESNIKIFLDHKNGVLRLPEGIVSFKHGQSDFQDKESEVNLKKIANTIAAILPCYLPGHRAENCPETTHYIESILIEGHTDTTGDEKINWTLSTQRALKAFWLVTQSEPELNTYTNEMGQPLLSVSGYGESRPLNYTSGMGIKEYNRNNRRIDFRFLMVPPENYIIEKHEKRLKIKGKSK